MSRSSKAVFLALLAVITTASAYFLVHRRIDAAWPGPPETRWPVPAQSNPEKIQLKNVWTVPDTTYPEGMYGDQHDQSIYVLRDGGLRKIGKNGKTIWKTPLGLSLFEVSRARMDAHVVTIVNADGYSLVDLDHETGKLLKR